MTVALLASPTQLQLAQRHGFFPFPASPLKLELFAQLSRLILGAASDVSNVHVAVASYGGIILTAEESKEKQRQHFLPKHVFPIHIAQLLG